MGLTSTEFATRLLEEERVAMVPGTAFGEYGEGFVRCSFATGYDDLIEACNRIERFVKSFDTSASKISESVGVSRLSN